LKKSKGSSRIKLHFNPLDQGGVGFDQEFSLDDLRKFIKKSVPICKPCWELKYCPYGGLVEGFPLPSIQRSKAIEHNEYLKKCLKTGTLDDGTKLDKSRRRWFEEEVSSFQPENYLESIPKEIVEMSCTEFGHLCPVFFHAEPFTESKEGRKAGRKIPRHVLLRVVRRDDSTCQKCGKKLLDHEIEIDHIIPFSKGGPTTESNLQVKCKQCNRNKSDSQHEITRE